MIGPYIVGREARANPVAIRAKDGLLPPTKTRDEVAQENSDNDYLRFLARNITSLEQFDHAMLQVRPDMTTTVRELILPLLPMPIQTAIRLREVDSDES